MKKTRLLTVLFMAVAIGMGCTSCDKEDDNTGIMIRMRNADNGKTTIDCVARVYIDGDNNFCTEEGVEVGCVIASVGKVSGLSKIKEMPPLFNQHQTGSWAEKVAVEPGMGYVVLGPKTNGTIVLNEYGDTWAASRIWVEDWIKNSSGGIIGAVVYYEYVWPKTITE